MTQSVGRLGFVKDLQITEPGVVDVAAWRAATPPDGRTLLYGGAARKPRDDAP